MAVFITISNTGVIVSTRRSTLMVRSISASFAAANRSSSYSFLIHALMRRMPAKFSRITPVDAIKRSLDGGKGRRRLLYNPQ